LANLRILVVDDNHLVLHALRAFLESFDYVVYVAGNGVEALRRLENHPVDLVLTDVNMPLMDGLRLTAEIHQRYPQICIIVSSTDIEKAAAALDAGAHFFLAKPYATEELVSAIGGLFGSALP
jgi:CheY-like chemotaxis protein